ncbi:heme lyase CcmF/NrfE family subunit [Sedimenticola hydrogenitrophicus]|uniref:heme lyase CcmF/NrfE family subunit n=1 Tax=Sedimenticola hydrogenitrophicus TaxID=2967975 RepID=UPI0021A37D28|nr:heme lyase CcmF/NrfE family subunit [Sedimenticola hydrogenitrophicus]
MIPETGLFALLLALVLALLQGTLPLAGARTGHPGWIALARPAAWGQCLFLSLALAVLAQSFIANDFSVAYVAANSNSQLPLIYRITAVWGGHEGSLLLWVWILSAWGVAVSHFSHGLPRDMLARVLGVMGLVGVGFLLFLVFTSNPFERLPVPPVNGRDLNPLLQDPGLILHPPLLYMGYVGFSVAFAFALAALLGGQLDAVWARWSRPWTTLAWVFLTAGIMIGSWWAYYELGWGGWWFWDPVENSSFMPWLAGIALIHSLAVTEKRGVFKSWTVLLAILTFSLSLLGTFLVRSGVLTSVHAFASDPARGIFILVLLSLAVGGSLTLYAWRAPKIQGGGKFQLFSRETLLLANNLVLVVATATVLLGTLYPLALDALGVGKISVGPPYFNSVFVPLMVPLIFITGIGPMVRWKQDRPGRLLRRLWLPLLVAIPLGGVFTFLATDGLRAETALGLMLALWLTLTTARELYQCAAAKSGFWRGLRALPSHRYGMLLAHLGLAVTVVGITLASGYSVERDVRVAPGGLIPVAGYLFEFGQLEERQGPNYSAVVFPVRVTRDGHEIGRLRAEKRNYGGGRQPMSEAAILPGLFRDLYVAMGEPLEGGAWSVRVYYKPFVRWIWLGALLMMAGGFLAAFDRRYRLVRRRVPDDQPAIPGGVLAGEARS